MNTVLLICSSTWWKATWRYVFKELAEESLKMPVWKYNEICYPAINDKRVTDYAVDKSKTEGDIEVIICSKDMPYILDWTFYRYEVEKYNEAIKGYTISKVNNNVLNHYI